MVYLDHCKWWKLLNWVAKGGKLSMNWQRLRCGWSVWNILDPFYYMRIDSKGSTVVIPEWLSLPLSLMSLTLFILFHSIILHTTLLCYPLLFPLHLMSLSLSSPDARSPPDSCYNFNTAGQCYGKCGIQQPCTTSCTAIPCAPEYVCITVL